MKPRVASHHPDTCSWNVWRKSIQGKWQKWCVVHVTLYSHKIVTILGDRIGHRIADNNNVSSDSIVVIVVVAIVIDFGAFSNIRNHVRTVR